MEQLDLETTHPVLEESASTCEDEAEDSSSSHTENLINKSKLKMETTPLQTSKQILQNMTTSIGHENPKYELFSTVFIDREPNYCFRVTALNLVAIGKGRCEEEAVEKCARNLVNKFNPVKISMNTKKSKITHKLPKNCVETEMSSLAIADVEPNKILISENCVKQSTAIIRSEESEKRSSSIREPKPVVTDKSITSTGPKIRTKIFKRIGSNKGAPGSQVKPEKSFKDNHVDSNSNVKSSPGNSKHKNSAKTKIYCPNNAYVQSAVDTRLLAKIKDCDFGANPIQKLQDICVKSQIQLPRYNFLRPSISPNGNIFKMQCSFLGYIVYGRGRTKREAKSQAAANMMRNMIALGWHIDSA